MVENVTVQDLAAGLQRGERVVDVRQSNEFDAGHVPGAEPIPMHLVPLRIEEFRAEHPVFLICESGNRSWQVGEFLARQGIPTRNVIGGTSAWRALGLPLATGANA